LARELKLLTLKPENLRTDANFLRQLAELQADLFVVAAYGKILPADIITLPKYKTLNVHGSLLPKYRGSSPIQFALWQNEPETGVSIMLMDEQVDHGAVLAQKKVTIDPDDNFITLSEKLSRVGAALLTPTINDYVQGKTKPQVQDESLATLTHIISKADGKINWQESSQQIYNQFRALFPWPGVWTTWNGQTIKILDCLASASTLNTDKTPGTVLPDGSIVCGDNSALQIISLQPAGKNEMPMTDFLNGHKDFLGGQLNR
jgi:methionyl-tRNA formyltransferase